MVGIVIFTLGLLGAYLLIQSANEVSVRSRDEVIGANILREQAELLKNLRDTNWIALRNWNSIASAKDSSESDTTFTPGYYTIENDYRDGKSIRIRKLTDMTSEKDSILKAIRSGAPAINLCRDTLGRLTHDCTANEKTSMASFLKVDPLETTDAANAKVIIDNAYKITAYFVTTDHTYREYTMSTILTDWKK